MECAARHSEEGSQRGRLLINEVVGEVLGEVDDDLQVMNSMEQ